MGQSSSGFLSIGQVKKHGRGLYATSGCWTKTLEISIKANWSVTMNFNVKWGYWLGQIKVFGLRLLSSQRWAGSDGSRIPETFGGGGNLLFGKILTKNCMEMKKIGPRGWELGASLAPTDPQMVRLTRTLPILGEVSPVFHDFCTHFTVFIVVGVGSHERITKCIVHVISMHHAWNRGKT